MVASTYFTYSSGHKTKLRVPTVHLKRANSEQDDINLPLLHPSTLSSSNYAVIRLRIIESILTTLREQNCTAGFTLQALLPLDPSHFAPYSLLSMS